MQQPLPGQRVLSHQGVPRVQEQALPAHRHRATRHLHVHHVLLLRDQTAVIVAAVHCQKDKLKKKKQGKALTKNSLHRQVLINSFWISFQKSRIFNKAVEMKGFTRKQKLIARENGSVNHGCLFLIEEKCSIFWPAQSVVLGGFGPRCLRRSLWMPSSL